MGLLEELDLETEINDIAEELVHDGMMAPLPANPFDYGHLVEDVKNAVVSEDPQGLIEFQETVTNALLK